jgi:hypothetical protein
VRRGGGGEVRAFLFVLGCMLGLSLYRDSSCYPYSLCLAKPYGVPDILPHVSSASYSILKTVLCFILFYFFTSYNPTYLSPCLSHPIRTYPIPIIKLPTTNYHVPNSQTTQLPNYTTTQLPSYLSPYPLTNLSPPPQPKFPV